MHCYNMNYFVAYELLYSGIFASELEVYCQMLIVLHILTRDFLNHMMYSTHATQTFLSSEMLWTS